MKKKYLLILVFIYPTLLLSQPIQHQKDGEKFRVGLYALQDGNNSSISGIINQVIDAHLGVTANEYEAVNIVIPYRTWYRVSFPNFDLNEWFGNYMEEMYEVTQHNGAAYLQTVSVPLYSQFVDPPFDTSEASRAQNENDLGNNRSLNTALFDSFINAVLQREFNIVSTAVNGNENLIRSILGNKDNRPLGGWYLDDEPLVRNHDVQVVNQMGSRIRVLENNFRLNNAVLNQLSTSQYQQKRYIAFDANDLHDHYSSSTRKLDGDIYNENGITKNISNSKRYSIFESNVDVLMPDFYNENHQFWHTIIQQIRREYELNSLPVPEIIPVIRGFKNDNTPWFSEREYSRLRDELIKDDVDGLFLYRWPNGQEDNYLGSRGLWNDGYSNIGNVLEGIESFTTDVARDDLALLYDQNSNAQRTLVLLSDGDSFRDKNWNDVSDAKASYWLTQPNSTFNFDQVKFLTSGDFNGDGKDDLALLYDQNSNAQRTLVLLSDGDSFRDKHWNNVSDAKASYWLTQPNSTFNFDQVKFLTSGDFNGDGKDDLALLYDQNSNAQRTLVLLSDGDSFRDKNWNNVSDAKASYWLTQPNSSFNFDQVEFLTSGDFNGDGKDDLALLYNQNSNAQRTLVLLSDGDSFRDKNWNNVSDAKASYWLTQPNSTFNFDQVKFLTSGDFNGDGKDDLALLYDQNSNAQRTLVLLSDGDSFRDKNWNNVSDAKASYWLTQPNSSFNFDQVEFLTSGDFNGDGKNDLALLYNQNSAAQRTLVLFSDGDSFRDKNWNNVSDAKASYWLNQPNSTFNFDQVKFLASGDFYSPIFFTLNSQAKNTPNAISFETPSQFNLSQNYPNPFNPITQIQYELPASSFVKLEVFNIAGQKVATLLDERKSPGRHEVTFDASNFATGLYIYRIQAGNFVETKKLILIK